MPMSRNRMRFFLTWLRRAAASRCCVSVMMAAVRSSNFSRTCPVSHSDRISAEVAVRSWQTVSSGFFPPPLLVYLDQEQMADSGQDQVAAKRAVMAPVQATTAAALGATAYRKLIRHTR